VTSCEACSRDLNCRRGELRPDSRIAVVTDNRKHHQMRLFEAFEISEELAVSRCERRISARISTVCRDDGEALEIRCSIQLSYGRKCVINTLFYSEESTFDRAISKPQNVHILV
jgi:hypothetical protein